MEVIKVYADESSQNAHRYLVLGLSVAARVDSDKIFSAIRAARQRHRLTRELKWAKVSKAMFSAYVGVLDCYFELMSQDLVHFHALAVDTSTMDHDAHSGGNAEIGFNKLIYQLLLHRVGRRYGVNTEIQVHLDNRTHSEDPNGMTEMLNAALKRDWNIQARPFKYVHFADSGAVDLLQLTDVIIGAIAHRKNRFHLRPDAAPHKQQLIKHIASRALEIERRGILSPRAKRFSLWNFRYNAARSHSG